MKTFLKEFKEFAMQGNVMDMAVGIIIGGAFTAIVNSLVNDILNPLLGLVVGKDFSRLTADIGDVHFAYGNFIMAVINFILIALVLFCIIRALNKLSRKKPRLQPESAPTARAKFRQTPPDAPTAHPSSIQKTLEFRSGIGVSAAGGSELRRTVYTASPPGSGLPVLPGFRPQTRPAAEALFLFQIVSDGFRIFYC